jgi:hypothetical protein
VPLALSVTRVFDHIHPYIRMVQMEFLMRMMLLWEVDCLYWQMGHRKSNLGRMWYF